MTEWVIEARGLTKRYGKKLAVDGIDLHVRAGEIFGLLGPNGAGKTTTILMLLGLTECSAGEVRVCGADPMRDPMAVKRAVGYLPDSVGFYDNLSARANLRYTARLADIAPAQIDRRLEQALARVRLLEVADQKVGTFSRGMRQRLGLAEVLMKQARVAILDEPTNGLDPQSSFEFLDLVRALRDEGIAVLLSSHILERVQAVCDRVALFNRGRIALEGAVRELAATVLGARYTIELETVPGSVAAGALGSVAGVREVREAGAGQFRVAADADVRAELVQALSRKGLPLLALSSPEPSLELIYRIYFDRLAQGAEAVEGVHGQA
jgi:ABC-2 type transport system ATP-binding protein